MSENNLQEAVKNADLIIEAVPEILELKQKIFHELEAITNDKTIFATNTSAIIGKIGSTKPS